MNVVDAKPSNGCSEVRQRVHSFFRRAEIVSRSPMVHERLQERLVHSILPIRRDGIAPTRLSETASKILRKSAVKMDLERFTWHIPVLPPLSLGVLSGSSRFHRRIRQKLVEAVAIKIFSSANHHANAAGVADIRERVRIQ